MMKWNNKGEGKQLTPKQRLQRQKLIVYPIFTVIFIFVMYFIFVPSATRKDSIEEVNGYNVNIPVSEGDNITNDKKAAYEAEDIRQKQNERKTLEDYAFELTAREEESKSLSLLPEKEDQATGVVTSVTTYKDLTKEMQSFYQPINKEDREKENLQRQIEQLQQQLQGIQTQPNQQELMEESYKLAAQYLNPTQVQTTSTPVQNNQPTNKNTVLVQPDNEKVITRLGDVTDSTFIRSFSKKRNFGFNTISSKHTFCQVNTIQACVSNNQVLIFNKSNTQIVTLRLLENIRIKDICIPKNTLIIAEAKLQSERLQLAIRNIQYAGYNIPVYLKILDLNGQEGIYIPSSVESNSVKDIAGNTVGNAGTSINLGNNAGQQLITDVSREIIQGATSYLNKKIKVTKVTIKTNYRVLLINQQ